MIHLEEPLSSTQRGRKFRVNPVLSSLFPVATGSTELVSYLTFLIWNRWFPLSITVSLPVIVWCDKYINRWTEIYFFDQWAWDSASWSTSFMYYWLHDRSLRVIIHSLTFILTTFRGVSLIFAPRRFLSKVPRTRRLLSAVICYRQVGARRWWNSPGRLSHFPTRHHKPTRTSATRRVLPVQVHVARGYF